jgi:hypothetical protein
MVSLLDTTISPEGPVKKPNPDENVALHFGRYHGFDPSKPAENRHSFLTKIPPTVQVQFEKCG